jgi:hypothetical protein
MTAHPQLPAPLGGPPPAPSVAAELEDIFLRATGLPSGRAVRLPPSRTVRSLAPGEARRSRIPVATFGALAAAALIGVSTGAVMLSRPSATPAPAPQPAAPTAGPSALPAPAAPVVTLAGADESPTNLAEQKVERTSAPRAAAPARRAGRVTHADLMTADRRLRRAYAQAIDAGVPRHVLSDYRDRWEDLRHDASWRPERVASGYDAMAGDLTRLSQRHRRRAAPPRRGWSEWRNTW